MLNKLTHFAQSIQPQFDESASSGRRLLRVTGWLLVAVVAAFTVWFFSHTQSGRDVIVALPMQSVTASDNLNQMLPMRERLRAVTATSRVRTVFGQELQWARLSVPPGSGKADRTIHVKEKNIGRADFTIFNEAGDSLLIGRAGAAVEASNSRPAFPGFAIDIPQYMAGEKLEIVMRIEPVGILNLTADLWRPSDFVDSQSKSQQRTILLIGALMFLAVYALAAANAGQTEHFLVFGLWLIARSGFVIMESGFNFFAFGELAGSMLGLKLAQFAYLSLPFATLMLVRKLFGEELSNSPLRTWLHRLQLLSGAFLTASLLLPAAGFQVAMWIVSILVCAAIVWVIVHAVKNVKDTTTYWFLGGIACDATGSAIVALNSIGAVGGYFAGFEAEQISLIAAVLTGMAVGTTLSKERRRRIDTQAAAIEVLGKYEDVYRTVPIGLVSIGADGHILRYNEGFARMFGLETEESRKLMDNPGGAHSSELDAVFPTGLRNRIRAELEKDLECDFEFRLMGHDSIRWLRVLARGAQDSYEASATDITAQKELQDQLARAAEHDPLTGALNRLGLANRMQEILETSPDLEHVALCYVDLDRFKMLNDMFGHNAGDSVLVEVVKRFGEVLGPKPLISRLGGDEFAIALPPADQSVQEGLAWKALESITERPFEFDDKSFSVTASIGVFHLVPKLSQSELVAGADRSCQEAKRKGRNQVVMCADSKALVEQRQSELSLVARLHDDTTFNEFELVAQPIVSLHDRTDLACEILLRHRSSDGQLVPAGPLIAAAEQNGAMARIDRWVLRRTLEWLELHADDLKSLRHISLNLSGSSLNDEFFKTYVVALLQKHRSIANRIVLEVTESVAMQDIFMMARFIDAVRDAGAKIALDDFGSGYSNFASLTDVQASFLKIDGRFVSSLRQKNTAATIVRTISMLAHELQMKCVAEWVEDTETLQLLRSLGADYAQGHAIAQPFTLDELVSRIRSSTPLINDDIQRLIDSAPPPEQSSFSLQREQKLDSMIKETDTNEEGNRAFLAL